MKLFTGYFCLLLGVAGVLLPIIPGIPFLLVAVKLLGLDHPLIKPFADRIRDLRAAADRKWRPDRAAENDACPALPVKLEPPPG